MFFKFSRFVAASMVGLSVLTQPSFADNDFATPFDPDVLWPEPISIQSSFEGLGVDIKGTDMAMTLQEAQQASGGSLSKVKWRFADRDRLSKEKLVQSDVSKLRVVLENSKDVRDEIVILGSRWHTGNQTVRMTRSVTINAIARQPLVETFVNAVIEKYGALDDEPFRKARLPGLRGLNFTGRLWTWDNRSRNATCEVLELPNDLKDIYQNKLRFAEQLAKQVEAPDTCDGILEIYHDTTAAGTVKHYRIAVTDIRMLALDALNDRRVRDHMQLYLEKAAGTNNTNSPDL